MALVASALMVLLSALVLASAQTRVLRAPKPRWTPYAIAWIICALLLGAVRSLGDYLVGSFGERVAIDNVATMAAISFFAFAAGDISARLGRRGWSRTRRFTELLVIHAAAVSLVTIF
jgi:hypothetical protein